jgi:ketosteroid isomerase-like protein
MTSYRSHPNAKTLEILYEDLTRIGDHVDEHVVLHPATRRTARPAGDVVGREAVTAWERELVASSGDTLVMDVEEIVANDHFGAVFGTLVARFDGQRFAQAFCGLWRFRDGWITEHWENIQDPELLASLTAPRAGGS